ncbi:hypothetical protein BJV74DRAFT_83231 [Russula compacta]|nr:hypothetical protein BJV74DRAFT_83231 [Russula compacta]
MEVQITLDTFLAFMIQLFYARRLYLISKSIVLVVIVAGLAVFNFGTGIVLAVREHMLKRYSRESTSIWLGYMGMGSFVFLDALIAVSMCWCLYRRRTGYARTDTIITTLMIYIISSGMLTSILGLASVISFVAAPTTFISQVFYLPFGTCYVNCLLALLNNRDLIIKGSITDELHSPSSRTGHKFKTGLTPVHRTATVDLTVSKHGPDMEANALEMKRLVRSLRFCNAPRLK